MKASAHLRQADWRDPTGGFMLVEMLVAMAVGAFLLVALASITAFVLRSHERILRQAQAGEDLGRALAALSGEIREAGHLRWAGRTGGLVFSGSNDRLMFAKAMFGADGLVQPVAVLLQARTENGKAELLRSEAPLLPTATSPDSLGWGPPVSLFSGTGKVAFAYFMALNGDGGEALFDDWLAVDRMPAAVRVSFLSADPEGKMVSLRIPFLVDAEPACTLPGSTACGASSDKDGSQAKDDEKAPPVDADDPQGWNRYAR